MFWHCRFMQVIEKSAKEHSSFCWGYLPPRNSIPVKSAGCSLRWKFMPYQRVSKASVMSVLYSSGSSTESGIDSGFLSFSKPFLPWRSLYTEHPLALPGCGRMSGEPESEQVCRPSNAMSV